MERLMHGLRRTNGIIGFALLALAVLGVGLALGQETGSAAGGAAGVAKDHFMVRFGAYIAAALATGLGSIGAGIAVSNVGAAAMGATAERPELMGKSLIYVALAEGIAIYGLLISIIILAKV